MSYFSFFYLQYQTRFSNYGSYFELLYSARSLWGTSFSVNQITGHLSEISLGGQKKFVPIYAKFDHLMQLGITQGSIAEDDFDNSIEGLWNLLRADFDSFKKFMLVLRMIHIIVFFVPSYFLIIYFLLETMQF